MSKRLYPHNRVRYWYAYDLDDICALFSDSRLHKQTIRKWIKGGLNTIDKGKPVLIYGNDLIAYIKARNIKNKCSTDFDQLFCMKCQDARYIYQNMIKVDQNGSSLKVSGLCRKCKAKMFQNYKLDDFSQLRKIFTLVGVLELYDSALSPDKTHIKPQDHTPINESGQGILF